MNVREIQEKFSIKQSTAYKWRKWLVENALEVNAENLEKIHNRTYNLSGEATAIAVVEQPQIIETSPVVQPRQPQGEVFGMSLERVRELNEEVALETEIKDKLREYHDKKKREEKAQKLKARVAEVEAMDLGEFAQKLGEIIGAA
ncbi:MAG: hypothetical protein LRZ84_22845 [Desertifilum sp.]|nr:hypothetical protein [Desertifilum sp.]